MWNHTFQVPYLFLNKEIARCEILTFFWKESIMVAISNEMRFNQIWNELNWTLLQGELLANVLGVQLVPILWIPVTKTLPVNDLSCLVTVTDDDQPSLQPFILVSKFNFETNEFVFYNDQLKVSERILAWTAFPRGFCPDRTFWKIFAVWPVWKKHPAKFSLFRKDIMHPESINVAVC